jgi:hypothetical protein
MKIQNAPVQPPKPNALPPGGPAPEQPNPEQPGDSFQPSFTPKEKRSYLEAVKTGLVGAALVGVPAAMGAAKNSLFGPDAATISGFVTGPTFGAVAGGYGGWKLTPGKDQGGILLAFLTVPLGATVGAIGYPLLSTIGAAGGWTGAAIGAAIGGIGLGVTEAVMVHKYNQGVDEYNQQNAPK